MPTDWVEFYFSMSNFTEGGRYKFVDRNDKIFVARLLKYSNYHMQLKVDGEDGLTCTNIFCIKSIEIHF